ncbi:MAG: hypothetical protein HZA52_01450 [Planctomycetes bacterium]|nr:hypothetical protein [Planctomycetota bacterium]
MAFVEIETVQFNHDSNSASHDALNLRRNATEEVILPEWRRGFCVHPEDSPAAYALAAVGSNTVTIRASFSTSNRKLASAELRAVDNVVDPPGPPGCLGILVAWLRALLRALFGNVLGCVAPKVVHFANGQTGPVVFALIHTKLGKTTVGTHTTEWRWQARATSSDPWSDIGVTRHRIYVLADVPTEPWTQAPFAASNTSLPWTEALDYACQWAVATRTRVEVAAAVTRHVYALGPNVVTYDCPGGGSSHYSWGGFELSAFLDRLHGGPGNGVYVNCSDCATITSTFANLLGADLWQSRMGWGFDLNPLLGIGSSMWQPACGWSGFGYHEVAWTGACDVDDRVFDACLQVDGDPDPTNAPHTPLLPIDLRFGNTGDGDYRDRLATPTGRPNCDPQPTTRQRRALI